MVCDSPLWNAYAALYEPGREDAEMTAHNNYMVKPVDKALQVLTSLAEAGHELSLKEICARVGLPKTTVFRYLYTLGAHGYVAHNSDADLYRLGPRSWQLGQSAQQYARLIELALPLMQELRDRFDETVNLGVLNRTDVVYLGMVESRRALRMQAAIGGRDPAYSTSLGKAILAFLPESQRLAHLPPILFPRTDRTLTSLTQLDQDLALTRQRGYALDNGENEEGACCIGAPITDAHGHVLAALSISAPANRLPASRVDEVAQALIQAAANLSQQLALGHPDS
jgi:IclR family acetate operon transcriptional repressor